MLYSRWPRECLLFVEVVVTILNTQFVKQWTLLKYTHFSTDRCSLPLLNVSHLGPENEAGR